MDFTGTHLLIDLFGCHGLDDIEVVEATLRETVAAAGATLLELRLHGFGKGQGVTGVAMLAESHISIHTWPEKDYAAADIFLCGRRHDLDAALKALASGLTAERYTEQRLQRGYGVEVPVG
ncbi:adenosylmethionine decarboxylase [Sphingomonas alpina]|uniref:S-adenosylmethionine decarboxylase proenzyme n=1 Tax=Sphingomonas alpina TaxID=653931 RepID=A0A7H0LJH3_9SPHN|nr:adenosylmethionine decarboxylase [Sphingomonas alpina]QNQ09826.1 adenosylmethionine decarboxylase [Sphingomonas alpina]